MPLNIKDEAVTEQARRLAKLTGQSITAAVREAVANRLREIERASAQVAPPRTPERLLAMAREIAAQMPSDAHSADHADLYGEDGLPE